MQLRVITLSQMWLEILLASDRHGLTVTEVCRRYGISRKTYYAYRARYRAEGLPGLEPRSRRPHGCAHRTPEHVEDLIVALRERHPRWGARKIRAELVRQGLPAVPAASTVHAVLRRSGLVGEQRRRRTAAMHRFVREVPNDLWQIDATQVALADGSRAWIIDILDDHARYAIGALACRRATTSEAWRCIEDAIRAHGVPRQVISDNGLSFTGRRHRREVLFERNLKALGVHTLTSRPRHPQTCGKLERFHQTLKQWLADRPPADSIATLQVLLDEFRWHYNVERPHQALAQTTPADAYDARPKAGPLTVNGTPRPPRTLRISDNGTINYCKRKIQLGTPRAGQVVQVVEDNGLVAIYLGPEKIRELLLGPAGSYHSNGVPRGRPKKKIA